MSLGRINHSNQGLNRSGGAAFQRSWHVAAKGKIFDGGVRRPVSTIHRFNRHFARAVQRTQQGASLKLRAGTFAVGLLITNRRRVVVSTLRVSRYDEPTMACRPQNCRRVRAGQVTLVVLMLVGLAKEAQTSRIHYEEVALPELVRSSTHILVVKEGVPASRRATTPIHPNQKKFPPYVRSVYRYRVVETLKGSGHELVGKTIEVWPADDEHGLRLHKSYYLRHLSISPIERIYRPQKTEDGDRDPCIVFLVEMGKSYAFTVQGAVENMANRKEILALVLPPDPFAPGVYQGRWSGYDAVYRLNDRQGATISGTMELRSGPFQGEVRPVRLEQRPDGSIVLTRTISPSQSQVVVTAEPLRRTASADAAAVTIWNGPMTGYQAAGEGEIQR
jgi:hypothetical protein